MQGQVDAAAAEPGIIAFLPQIRRKDEGSIPGGNGWITLSKWVTEKSSHRLSSQESWIRGKCISGPRCLPQPAVHRFSLVFLAFPTTSESLPFILHPALRLSLACSLSLSFPPLIFSLVLLADLWSLISAFSPSLPTTSSSSPPLPLPSSCLWSS